jgi:hypothetical protein
MGTAPPVKQASIENDPAVKQEGLGYRCHTFSSSDEQTTVVAFWEAKPWDPNATTKHAVITLPLAHEPHHIFLHDLLTGTQTEISGKWSEDVSNEAPPTSPSKDSARSKSDRRFAVAVSLSAVPQLLIVR